MQQCWTSAMHDAWHGFRSFANSHTQSFFRYYNQLRVKSGKKQTSCGWLQTFHEASCPPQLQIKWVLVNIHDLALMVQNICERYKGEMCFVNLNHSTNKCWLSQHSLRRMPSSLPHCGHEDTGPAVPLYGPDFTHSFPCGQISKL